MKEDKFKYHSLDIPLYFGSLQVCIGSNLDKVYEAAGFPVDSIRGRNPDSFDAIAFEAEKDGHIGFFVVMRPTATPKIVAHEALHIVNKIMAARGILADLNNDEPQAYLLGWIVEQMHYALTSKEVKAKKKIKLR